METYFKYSLFTNHERKANVPRSTLALGDARLPRGDHPCEQHSAGTDRTPPQPEPAGAAAGTAAEAAAGAAAEAAAAAVEAWMAGY